MFALWNFLQGAHLLVLRNYTWLYTQNYGMQGVKPRSATCKPNAILAVQLLQINELISGAQ